jgi:RNA polymerase sigma factor (sigma-70 family)
LATTNINELYAQIRAGDLSQKEALFRALRARFSVFVRQRTRNKEDIEDIVQNALMTISREYCNLDISAGFSTWAYKVLEHRMLAFLKDRTRSERRSTYLNTGEDGNLVRARATDLIFKRTLLECLTKVGRANRRYARILNLKNQGYTADEICRRLNVTTNNFYSILHRARKMLETCLDSGDVQ